MSNPPLVSIVTPFKNTALFLEETLDSILAQTYQNWELIIVDDHSTDKGWEIVSSFAQKDDRIRPFVSNGKGIIEALRLAYSHAQGDYITRMDSDDLMASAKLEIMVRDLQRSGPGYVALGLVKYFSNKGVGEGFANYEKWLNGLTLAGDNYADLYKECVIPSPCWMVYREDFDAVGGFTPDRYPEDYDLVFRFFQNGLKCIPSNEVLHYWRDHPSRASRTDKNYADNTFMDLKLFYFLQLHRLKSKPLVVWGAGAKGKRIAQILTKQQIDFNWVCDNPKKIGKEIYGKQMLAFTAIDELSNAQNIITVANPSAQIGIKKFFSDRRKESLIDYFFFC